MSFPRQCLALAVSLALLAAVPVAGAPLVCFSIVVDDPSPLPFGTTATADENKPTVPLDELPRKLAALFAANGEIELHMEALRRASFACENEPCRESPVDESTVTAGVGLPSTWTRLLGVLESAVIAAELLPESAADTADRRARAWFDLGYAREVGATMGHCSARGLACLEKAAALAPTDGGVRFGAAIAAFQAEEIERDGVRPTQGWRPHLAAALVKPTPQLSANLMSTFGAFLDLKDLEQLRAAVHDERPGR